MSDQAETLTNSDKCPDCGGDLYFSQLDIEQENSIQEWVCDECGRTGHDVYKFVDRIKTNS